MLKRLVTLPFVTFFSLSFGFVAGILLAPSSGSETRSQMSLFMEQNQNTIKQLQKWVKKKKAWAQCSLGGMHYHGTYGVKKDVKRAFVLYTLAAEYGKKALSVCTIADHFEQETKMTPKQRETGFTKMVEAVLQIC